jgi:hypothetical protein
MWVASMGWPSSWVGGLRPARRSWAVALAATLVGCGASPPAQWARGGGPLDVFPATWTRGEQGARIDRNGRVTVGEDVKFRLDAAGRIADGDGKPFAVLGGDGRLIGPDDEPLATVDAGRARTSDGSEVALLADGAVVRRRSDGTFAAGAWQPECLVSPATRRTCTLVAYLVLSDDERSARALEQAERRKQRTHPR